MNRNFKMISCLSLGMMYTFSLTALPSEIVKSAIWIAWSFGTYQTFFNKNSEEKIETAPEPKKDLFLQKNIEEDSKKNDRKLSSDNFSVKIDEPTMIIQANEDVSNQKKDETVEKEVKKINQLNARIDQRHAFLDSMIEDCGDDCL